MVIGAGMGGLSCAIDLARAGFAVTVLEQSAAPGGKMRQVMVGGRPVDAGPTVLTMRWVFDELFAAAGRSLDRAVSLRPIDILARHVWPDESRLDLFADTDRATEAIGAFAGSAEAAGFRAYRAMSGRIHDLLRDRFLNAQATGPLGLAGRFGAGRLGDLFALRPFDTLWDVLGDYFQDPRLRQLFGRYATYCGSSPFLAPATLMMISHVEQQGVWTVDGGLGRLAAALEAAARSLGVTFLYERAAASIDCAEGRACAVIAADGERFAADRVVFNGDPQALASGLLGDGPLRAVPPGAARSLSAVTWAIAAPARGFPLVRHNVFFSGDYRAEFEDIRAHGRFPAVPTIYVCAQDRDDRAEPLHGPERLLVLINAPANGDQPSLDPAELSACERRVFDRLAHRGLILQDDPMTRTVATPETFAALYPATGGALYGQATHGWAAAFRRPGAASRIPGLYLAGGGVHPGAGAPMATLSGRLAARRLMADLASTRPFRRVAMSGGMSTRSATTGATG